MREEDRLCKEFFENVPWTFTCKCSLRRCTLKISPLTGNKETEKRKERAMKQFNKCRIKKGGSHYEGV